MTIDGNTRLIAHVGWPTGSFKAPLIYNPWFAEAGVNAVVVPMGVRAEDLPGAMALLPRLTNFAGALVTMPHKVAVMAWLDEVTVAARVAGACNAVKLGPSGQLIGDMFDGEGFVRGLKRKGRRLAGASALVVGAGGVGSAIAASLAAAGVAHLGLHDAAQASADSLGGRLATHFPRISIRTGSGDPEGFDIVVNATPLGMQAGDPLPFDVTRLSPATFVGEVVMKQEITPLLAAARARGCPTQVGIDMLFEQIPAYLEFFGLPVTTPEHLRDIAAITY
jgi:shikimate dehydrogenase